MTALRQSANRIADDLSVREVERRRARRRGGNARSRAIALSETQAATAREMHARFEARLDGLYRGSAFRAAELGREGGTCDVAANGRAIFRVTLRDGRVFDRCAIHGSGGLMLAESSVDRRVAKHIERYGSIRVYLVHRGHTDHTVDVAREQIECVEVLS